MNRQEIYNKVRDHLLKQGRRAAGLRFDEPACLYLNANGDRCAIGCLIPDGHPGLGFRGAVFQLLDTYPDLRDQLGAKCGADDEFLHGLQRLHDAHYPVQWAQMLSQFAERNGLQP